MANIIIILFMLAKIEKGSTNLSDNTCKKIMVSNMNSWMIIRKRESRSSNLVDKGLLREHRE